MNWPLTRGVTILFGLIISLLVLNGAMFLHNLNLIRDDVGWIAHNYEVVAELETLLSLLQQSELTARGYVLTGQSESLEPSIQSRRELLDRIENVRSLVRDDATQLAALTELERKSAGQYANLRSTVQPRQKGGPEVSQALAATSRDIQLIDELQASVKEMIQNERQLLLQRKTTTAVSYRRTLAAAVLSTALGIALIAALLTMIAREMKDRIRAQSLTDQQRRESHLALSNIGDAVITVDVAGRITFLNPAAESITRWTFEDALGQPLNRVFNIFHESTRQAMESPAARALREGSVLGLANHILLIAKDGFEVSIQESAAPVRDETGLISGVVLVFRDISVQRRLELLEQEQHATLAISERRKDEFLAMLAHELRNPIAPIANALQLMAIRTPGPAELIELREIMARQIDQMKRLIDDLLDVSRISRGKFDLRFETIELGAVLRSAVDTSRPLIEDGGHSLMIRVPPNAIALHGDHTRLSQVVANLLNNAAKYTERGGRIWLSIDVREHEVFIHVRDTGVGISPEQLVHVFEVFTQADASLTRAHGGLGIGLTLAKNIVEMHGGSIEAHSEGLGKGSEFIVRLPVVTSPQPFAIGFPPTEGTIDPLPKRRILVVDDLRASAMVLSRLLTTLGQEVQTAHSGDSALAAVESVRFDLIFSDIAMPEMNGYQLAAHLREHRNSRDAILVALTGYGQEDDADLALAAGFSAHLVKPAGLDDLRDILTRSFSISAKH